MNGNQEFSTTFRTDFSIASRFGIAAVKDTYKRAFGEWKGHYQYLTDLVMTLNHMCWAHYSLAERAPSAGIAEKQYKLSELYSSLYYKTHDYALKHLKGEELQYYLSVTD